MYKIVTKNILDMVLHLKHGHFKVSVMSVSDTDTYPTRIRQSDVVSDFKQP